MGMKSAITSDHALFTGTDRTLAFEIFAPDGVAMEDVVGQAFRWSMRKAVSRVEPFRTRHETELCVRTTGDGITITGVYNSSRALNTQRVTVSIRDTDTESLAGGQYEHALKRTDPDNEDIKSYGTVELLVASTI